MTVSTAYADALGRVETAFTGVMLAGRPVTVHKLPPVSAAALPAAWVETVTVSTGSSVALNIVTFRVVIVPGALEADELELARQTAVDALEAARLRRPWRINCQQSAELGGVTYDAFVAEPQTEYPAVC